MVWWVWFLQDFHTKKTKTGRQGDRETGRQGDRETRKTENKERSRHGGGDGPQGNWIIIEY